MSRDHTSLPNQHDRMFITDGGLETTLMFHDGIDLPEFAAFDLLKDEAGTARLREYFERYASIAESLGFGLLLESPTWRANADWASKLGYDAASLAAANRKAIDLMFEVAAAHRSPTTPVVVSGNIGPRGDGYSPMTRMTATDAERYHAEQITSFAATDADMVSAFTMNYVEEAIGVARAAATASIPAVISFTVETDGRLPSGDSLGEAIERTDAETDASPAYYMINCAHPEHFEATLRSAGPWVERIAGVRANASRRSHAELDESADLDDGDPDELGRQHVTLRALLPNLAVVGGCCGTDDRHVAAIGRKLRAAPAG